MIAIPIIAGLAPSFVWLLIFLKKDRHPEPNRMILKVFGIGMLVTVTVAFIEFYIEGTADFLSSMYPLLNNFFLLFVILASAFAEEFAKYLVVKEAVLSDPAFDEPIDAMLYMIIVGLGFAAVENMLILMSLPVFFSEATAYIIGFRFLGATFLHALCSAIVGYYLALSICEKKKKSLLVMQGITIATLLHGLYNFSIMKMVGDENFTILAKNTDYIFLTIGTLVFLALFAYLKFEKIKTKASVCKT